MRHRIHKGFLSIRLANKINKQNKTFGSYWQLKNYTDKTSLAEALAIRPDLLKKVVDFFSFKGPSMMEMFLNNRIWQIKHKDYWI